MRKCYRFVPRSATVAAILSASVSGAAFAEDTVVMNLNLSETRLSTTELLNSKPVVNRLYAPDTSSVTPNTDAGPYLPGVMTQKGIVTDTRPRAYGSFGIPYTSTRVQDGDQSASGATLANLLSTSFPYRTIGKLTFSAGYCSASLIRRSVLVTAAHCIQGFGSGNSTYSDYQFVPGHYGAIGATAKQNAPYGIWNWTAFVRPASWANGTDTGSGAARNNDLAVIALAKNTHNQFIGDITGYMGYGWNNCSFVSSPKTGNLQTAAVSTFGYPYLLDSGAIMQRTDGPTYTTVVGGAWQLWQGSDLTSGSSGGPWIVNFKSRDPVRAGDAVAGTASKLAVIGVTSWGTSDPNAPKDNYSSQFRQNAQYPNANYGGYGAGNIASLLSTLCNRRAPGGGTYASQGYCD